MRRYAMAASLAVALFVGGFMASNQFSVNNAIGDDYEALLSGVVEHMNEQAITLHASLETSDGQVTFAYIKGDSVGQLLDAGYEGYVSRIKPVRGGNLIIMSRTNKALQEADSQLEKALYWDI